MVREAGPRTAFGWGCPSATATATGGTSSASTSTSRAWPGGTYNLEATVDWVNNFYETDDTDNCTMSRVQIPTAGEGRIVTVEAAELPCPT